MIVLKTPKPTCRDPKNIAELAKIEAYKPHYLWPIVACIRKLQMTVAFLEQEMI